MKLVKHHTNEGQRIALVVKEGRKWMHVLYNGRTALKRIPITERKYFLMERDATTGEIRRFNRFARSFGARRKVAK